MKRLAAVFVSGRDGEGVLFICIIDGRVIGSDIFGTCVDGTIIEDATGYDIEIMLDVPPGVSIVQGVTAPEAGLKYRVTARLPANVDHLPFIEISTPFGPVNARFQFLRDFELP